MYCIHCGNQISDDAKFCSNCGMAQQKIYSEDKPQNGQDQVPENGQNFEQEVPDENQQKVYQEPNVNQESNQQNGTYQQQEPSGENENNREIYCRNCGTVATGGVCLNCKADTSIPVNVTYAKSRVLAGLLGIFFGCFGAHNFYLKYNVKAVIQVCLFGLGLFFCLTIIGALIGLPILFLTYLWGLIEGILILTGTPDKDANGVPIEI